MNRQVFRFKSAVAGRQKILSWQRALLPLLAAAFSPPAFAQVLEEVVVTAQKREQALQDVGISVSAFSGTQMEQLGWDTSDDVVSQLPGVTLVQPNGPSSFYFNVRGVAQNDFSGDNQESPVAVYIDEVYVPSPAGAGFQLFDFDRVEVLRGPQGTLYGRNATGGLVHFVTRKPTQETDAYVSVTAGDYSRRDVQGAIGGGLGGWISGRLSFTSNRNDGIIQNRFNGGDLNNTKVWAARGQLLFDFNENTSLLLNIRQGEADNTNAPFEHAVARQDSDGLGYEINDPDVFDLTGGDRDSGIIYTTFQDFGYRDRDGGRPHSGEYDTSGFVKVESRGATATVTHQFGHGIEFVSITDVNELARNYLEDSDASPRPFFSFSTKSDMEQFSQEFRVSGEAGGVRWVAGAYYLDFSGDLFVGGAAGGFAQAAFGPLLGDVETTHALFPNEFGFDSTFAVETKSTAVFGQGEYDFFDSLTLTFGLRWTREEKETDFVQYFSLFESSNSNVVATRDSLGIGAYWTYANGRYSNAGANAFDPAIPLLEGEADTSLDDSFLTAKLGLDWRITDDYLVYVSYNRGVKAGGFNAPVDATDFTLGTALGGRAPGEMNFDKEVLSALEAGFKADFIGGLIRLNGAAYYYDYEDYQAFALDSLTTFVFNTDAENKGFEVELAASPLEGMDILFGISHVDTVVEDAYVTPDGRSLDREMIMTPEWTANGIIRYEWALPSGSLAVQYDFNYMDDHFFQLKNAPVGRESAYTLSNVRLTYFGRDDRWSVSAFVENLTDEEYRQMVFDLAGSPAAGGFGAAEYYYGRPRWWGLSLNYNWQ